MTVRSLMTMRARVSHNTATGADAYGQPVPPVWAPLRVVPCHARHASAAELARDGDTSLARADVVVLYPGLSQPPPGTRVEAIEDRRGRVLFAGPLEPVTPSLLRGAHVETRLRRVVGVV